MCASRINPADKEKLMMQERKGRIEVSLEARCRAQGDSGLRWEWGLFTPPITKRGTE